MENIKIIINNQEFLLKKTNKSLIEFELMANKKISEIEDSFTDNIMLFYCMLKAANKDIFKYSFDEFLYILDENEDNIKVFNEYTQSLITTNTPEEKTKKKK